MTATVVIDALFYGTTRLRSHPHRGEEVESLRIAFTLNLKFTEYYSAALFLTTTDVGGRYEELLTALASKTDADIEKYLPITIKQEPDGPVRIKALEFDVASGGHRVAGCLVRVPLWLWHDALDALRARLVAENL